jgi:hypothetical protein
VRIKVGIATLVTLAACGPAFCAESVAKDDPTYLRVHHAGVETMVVQGNLADAFVAIRNGVSVCYFDRKNPLLWLGLKGVIVQESVKRKIKVELSDDKASGYVIYGVKAFWYAPAFQFDLRKTDQGVEVTYYYGNDNKMQRTAFTNAKAWLDGKADTCTDAH